MPKADLAPLDEAVPAFVVEVVRLERLVRTYEFDGLTASFYHDPLDRSGVTVRVIGGAQLDHGAGHRIEFRQVADTDVIPPSSPDWDDALHAVSGTHDQFSAWTHAALAAGAVLSVITERRYGLPAQLPAMVSR